MMMWKSPHFVAMDGEGKIFDPSPRYPGYYGHGFELREAEALPGREEYLNSEKYEIKHRNWNAPGNIIGEISQLNRLRRAESALQSHLGLSFYNAFNEHILYYGKAASGQHDRIPVAVSLNPHNAQEADFEIP